MSELHAAIDIGTNSIHLLVARLTDDGAIDVVIQEKDQVRLGSGSSDMTKLSAAAIDRGIAALQRFSLVAQRAGADTTAVATSAVREANNRATFLERAESEAGVHVEVISGVEEARLIYLGVLQALPVIDQRILSVDIGGGSTEFLVGEGGAVIDARSMKLGAIRLTDHFFPDGVVEAGAVADARAWIEHLLAPVAVEFRGHGYTSMVGCSGTIGTLAAMIEARRGNKPSSLNAVSFSHEELVGCVDELASHAAVDDRVELAGLDAGRADTIVGGAILLERAMALFDTDQLTFSKFALREGVFLDRFQQVSDKSFHHLSDIRRSSVKRLAKLFDEDRAHVEHATNLALRLFDDLHPLHHLGPEQRDLLEAAGWVHNVGLFISHSAHHKHSYYVIRHSDQLLGFTDHEIEIIAQVARYHRRSAPKVKHSEFAALNDTDRNLVSVLSGILRIGIALDRSHDGRVETVSVEIGEAAVISIGSSADDTLERYTFERRKAPLESAIGIRLALR